MIVNLDPTENFAIEYQDILPNALRRAKALRRTCESEFATLMTWFGVTKGFGSSNRVTLHVENGNFASNKGYRTDGTTRIVMETFNGASNQDDADDAVLGLFVAEIVEVLMSYNLQINSASFQSWNPSGSDGEGLSRVCAALFHQRGYYTVLNGPYINPWLDSKTPTQLRKNWISTTEPSDTDVDSFGCAILFIYFLHTQIGFSMQSIITEASTNLETTYHVLTGQSDGYSALTQLLDAYFPAGSTPVLKTDNPFPLRDPIGRRVVINFVEDSTGAATVDSTGTATLSPYPANCPVGTYKYTISNVPSRLRCSAVVTGFGVPVYRWRINGQTVSGSGIVQTTARVARDDPQNPDVPKFAEENVVLSYATFPDTSTYQQRSGDLVITNVGFPGHCWLDIEVTVAEVLAPSIGTVQSESDHLDTQRLDYEDSFRRDRGVCQAKLRLRIDQIKDYHRINILLTLPDPTPDVRSAAHVIQDLREEIAALVRHDEKVGHEVIKTLSHVLDLPAEVLGTVVK
ncbi:hypothetical protein [Paraburkholderia dipogonis]|uniref:hypothetical protein n=1 Tax=Paraburkholderia dipogonis TaxID=1211383 RepID=UPI0038B8BA60